jgi:plastocyanin
MMVLRLALVAAIWAAHAVAFGGAATGTVRGRVVVDDPTPPLPRPGGTDLSMRRAATPDRRHAVVYFESAPRSAFEELRAGRAHIDQRGEQFIPRVLAVTVGTTVDFPNRDTTFHNVFSLSRVRPFDLGRFAPGRTGSVRFDRPGVVSVFCDIHSHMSAYVLVFSHPFFAVTDDEGRYSIAGVPPGTYTLMVWSELGAAAPRRVTIADGGIAEIDFRIGASTP